MAGRPGRRARLEAAKRPELPEFPAPAKPLDEMSPAEREVHTRELRKFLRELRRPAREATLRAGRAKPRNRAE
jgi:hypothetical protein